MNSIGMSILDRVAAAKADLRPSERKVAELVLSQPTVLIHKSIAALAAQAMVSEPTVLRFCRAVGFDGWQDFKIGLAQALGAGAPYVHDGLRLTDTVAELTEKICNDTLRDLATLRNRIDTGALDRAIDLLAGARRIEFHGSGASGIVAMDAQHKFFRLDVPSVAYTDVHQQVMAAAAAREGHVLVLFSHTGRTRDILHVATVATERGAAVIAVTSPGSPLAGRAALPILVPTTENTDIYTPTMSRLAHLVVVDILATGVAMRRGPEFVPHLRRLKESLGYLRLAPDPDGHGLMPDPAGQEDSRVRETTEADP